MLEDQNNVKNHFQELVGGCSGEGKAVGGGQGDFCSCLFWKFLIVPCTDVVGSLGVFSFLELTWMFAADFCAFP